MASTRECSRNIAMLFRHRKSGSGCGQTHRNPDTQKKEAERIASDFEQSAFVSDGVVRWNSNNHVPPQDILDFWEFLEKPFDIAKSSMTREREDNAFIAEYRRTQANRQPSGEELAEMRAAFGEGGTVVNVITGRKINL